MPNRDVSLTAEQDALLEQLLLADEPTFSTGFVASAGRWFVDTCGVVLRSGILTLSSLSISS